jgi:recombination protein RecA
VAPAVSDKGRSELEAAQAEIAKVHGAGVVVRGDTVPLANHSPTGAFSLDLGLCGGMPEGYAVQIYGVESSGKTLIALLSIAGYQRKHPDKICVFVDAEKMYDPNWARHLGVDTERLQVIIPDTGEQAVDTMTRMLDVVSVGLVVLDSIPACVPQTMAERSAEDKTMGVLAALMGVLCSKILVSWGRERRRNHRVTVLLLNQFRMKVGFVLGDPYTLPGGRQINHLPTTKIKTRGKEQKGEDSGGEEVNNFTELFFTFQKTKHGRSIREGAFTVVLGDGHASGLPPGTVDNAPTIAVYALSFGLITKQGNQYVIDRRLIREHEPIRKKEAIVAWLRTHDDKAQLIGATIITSMRIRHRLPAAPPDGMLYGVDVRQINPTLLNDLARSASNVQLTETPEEAEDEAE